MANFKGHAISGLVAAALVGPAVRAAQLPAKLAFICAILAFVFALFPDVDIKSKFSKFFYSVIITVSVYMMYIGKPALAAGISIVSMLPQIVNHRGWFHSHAAAFLLPGTAWIAAYYSVVTQSDAIAMHVAGVVGYYTHILMDSRLVKGL